MAVSPIVMVKMLDLAFMAVEAGLNMAQVKKQTRQMAEDGQNLDTIAWWVKSEIEKAKPAAKEAIRGARNKAASASSESDPADPGPADPGKESAH